MVSKRPPYAPDATGFGADDAAFLADHGFNTVRLGAIYGAVEPQPGSYDESYLDRIEATEQELAAEGSSASCGLSRRLRRHRAGRDRHLGSRRRAADPERAALGRPRHGRRESELAGRQPDPCDKRRVERERDQEPGGDGAKGHIRKRFSAT
jgi:hypothetical protein